VSNNNLDRRVALSALLVVFGIHFLLQAFPGTRYNFSLIVPFAAFVIFLGVYGVVTGYQQSSHDGVFWSALLGFVGIIVLLQATGIVRFSFTMFAGASIAAAGLSILLSAAPGTDAGGVSPKNSLLWGVLTVCAGVVVCLSGLQLFSQHTITMITRSAVGILFLVLGLAVLVKGGKK
jgi:uncharacterized membrane protein HdeD (DUF308 family)